MHGLFSTTTSGGAASPYDTDSIFGDTLNQLSAAKLAKRPVNVYEETRSRGCTKARLSVARPGLPMIDEDLATPLV
jgi:hypothetical protein